MFVAIARFPKVPAEREAEFRLWFAWSNEQLRDIDGLQGRRLLLAPDGSYTVLIEHKSAETFAAMHATEVASRVGALRQEIPVDGPAATMYQVVADLASSGSCCGGAGGHGGQRRHDLALVGAGGKAQTANGCCR